MTSFYKYWVRTKLNKTFKSYILYMIVTNHLKNYVLGNKILVNKFQEAQ